MDVAEFFDGFGSFVEQLIFKTLIYVPFSVDLAFKTNLILCPNLNSMENVIFS